jgi:hypothetical protein
MGDIGHDKMDLTDGQEPANGLTSEKVRIQFECQDSICRVVHL